MNPILQGWKAEILGSAKRQVKWPFRYFPSISNARDPQSQDHSFNWQESRPLNRSPRSQTLVDGAQHRCWDSFSYTTEDSSASECFVKDIRIFTRARDRWEIARATFDTGSTYNWISKSFVEDRLSLPVGNIPAGSIRTCIAFSGHVIIPIGFVRLVWYNAEGAGRTTYETQFLVCDQENNLFDVVIGSRTIAREKILLWKIATVWSHDHTELRMPHQSKKGEIIINLLTSNEYTNIGIRKTTGRSKETTISSG
jgi:hypothetical protein